MVNTGVLLLVRFAVVVGLATGLGLPAARATENLVRYRDQIEQGYNARDSAAIEITVAALTTAGKTSGQEDLATYYAAFARLRQSALPGIKKERARDFLDRCISGLEPLIKRRSDYAEARALYASCLGASTNYYVLRAASRGMAARRQIAAALKLAPDKPWVVFHDAVGDFLTPAVFGGNKERALGKFKRLEKLFVASRPPGSSEPVFGESETWLYIGRAYLAAGDKDKGRNALEKAQTLDPGSADVRDEIAKFK